MGNGSVFTFHYVSINTAERSWETRRTDSFTFHYVSINTEKTCTLGWAQNYFTFHYVSINTKTKKLYHASHTPLHSNMFLLRPFPEQNSLFRQISLHSNMFLLIPRSSEPPINSSILYHILSTMVFFYLFIYFDITRFTGSTILLMFFTFVDLS